MSAAHRRDGAGRGSAFGAALSIAFGVVVTTTPALAAQRAAAAARGGDPREVQLEAIFADYAAPDTPGAVVVVTRGDSIVVTRAFGLADVATGVPMKTSTAFRLASVSKQFTAAAILALVEDGMLGLDDHVGEVLPEAPAYARTVSVRQLLAHTSGLPDYEVLLGDSEGPQLQDHDVLQLLHRGKTLYFTPGTAWRYSNSGYAMLALIVERASGQRFADFLRRRIFDRAGMPTAVAHVEGKDVVAHRAYGHSRQGDTWRRTDQSRTSAVLGDGGIYASAEELALWSAALDRHAVLTRATFSAATTPAMLASGATTSYGFGWFLDTHRGHRRQRHEGDTIGFRTAIQRYPDLRMTVIVLVNRGVAPIDSLSDAVADLFLR